MSELRRRRQHPYIGREVAVDEAQRAEALALLNAGRDNSRGDAVEVTYFFEVVNAGAPLSGLAEAAKMVLDHGTLKPWAKEGDPRRRKPRDYDEFMSWATDLRLIEYNQAEQVESGLVRIAYPLHFFDKRRDATFPLAQLLMAIASEPLSAFSFYQGARVVDVSLPENLARRCPGQRWPNRRVRAYLGLAQAEPMIGTIVKPKTGLTPELFSHSVVEAALAGAHFTKADENLHLTRREIPRFVGRVVRDLAAAGLDLGPDTAVAGTGSAGGAATRNALPRRRRFLFAPHITTDADRIVDCARAALDAGANALMFSPYYAGGFLKLAEIVARFDVPVYAHTAGMNLVTGCPTWGVDPRLMYVLAASFGAAFMQITTMGGYLKPDDTEKGEVLRALRARGLDGSDGMTLAIAGGLGPLNLGRNARLLGTDGRMFLAGSSVYGHPDGPAAGVKALVLAWRAFRERGAEAEPDLRDYAAALGAEGRPLARALPGGHA